VATGTRNVLRSIGGVVGVAVSTAAHYAASDRALRRTIPDALRKRVLDGTWRLGEKGTAEYEPAILSARMEGFRVVFIILVPMMVACLFASFFVADVILKGDAKNEEPEQIRRESVAGSLRVSLERSLQGEFQSGRRVGE
jgi:hypothetical protein